MHSRSDRFTYCVYNVANVGTCMCVRARMITCVYNVLCICVLCRVSPYIILLMCVCRFNVQLINYTG